MNFSRIDKKILDILQNNFPIVERPYKHIAASLSIKEDDVIRRLKKMKAKGVIRRIGPVFDSASLGYSSALCAVKTLPQGEASTARYISTFDGITHNYKRDSEFNIWFTLVAKSEKQMNEILMQIKKKTNPQKIIKLKSRKTYKIKGIFDVSEG